GGGAGGVPARAGHRSRERRADAGGRGRATLAREAACALEPAALAAASGGPRPRGGSDGEALGFPDLVVDRAGDRRADLRRLHPGRAANSTGVALHLRTVSKTPPRTSIRTAARTRTPVGFS